MNPRRVFRAWTSINCSWYWNPMTRSLYNSTPSSATKPWAYFMGVFWVSFAWIINMMMSRKYFQTSTGVNLSSRCGSLRYYLIGLPLNDTLTTVMHTYTVYINVKSFSAFMFDSSQVLQMVFPGAMKPDKWLHTNLICISYSGRVLIADSG